MGMAPLRTLHTQQASVRKMDAGMSAVAFLTMTAMVVLTYSFAITSSSILKNISSASKTNYCQWKGVPIMCGPPGLPGDTSLPYHNNSDGTFTDVSAKSRILKPGPRYSITAVSYDFDNDGWPDIYVAVDS
jgi:hypothetical protein